MISKRAVSAFLNRRLDNFLWAKQLKIEDFEQEYKRYKVRPYFKTTPWLNQHVMFTLALHNPYFLFLYDMGCVDSETEYLSPTGWKKISEYTSGQVAQYHPETGMAEFVQPNKFVKLPCQHMLKIKTKYGIDQMLSLEHRVLLHSRMNDKKHEVVQASELLKRHSDWLVGVRNKNSRTKIAYGESAIPVTFKIKGGAGIALNKAQLQVQVAVIADGHFPKGSKGNRCVIRVKKERKKLRIRKLLKAANIKWSESSIDYPTAKGFTLFRFDAPLKVKEFGEWAWQMNKEQLEVVAEEVVYWDGTAGTVCRGDRFFSRSKASADFVQYAVIASGNSARVTTELREDGIDYTVHVRNSKKSLQLKSLSSAGEKHSVMRIVKSTDGFKYCFMVPSTFLVLRRNGCVFCTGNTGKTKGILDIITQLQREKRLHRALVTVPGQLTIGSWDKAIAVHSDLHPIIVTGEIEEKWEKLIAPKGDIAIIDYAGLHLALAKKVKQGKKNVYIKDDKKIKQIQKLYNFYNGDDSHKIRSTDTIWFSILKSLTQSFDYRYLMTGTPMGKNPEDVFPQFYLADRGETFGDTLGMFRAAFCIEKPNNWKGIEYVFDKHKEQLFNQFMQSKSLRYTEDECSDIPQRHEIPIQMEFTTEQREHYLLAVEGLINAGGNLSALDNSYYKMRQIVAGFLQWDDEYGEHTIRFKNNPKMDALEELIANSGDSKIVVSYEYVESGKMITDRLTELGIGFRWVGGGSKDKVLAKERFVTDASKRVFVMQSEVGSTGTDGLQDVARYLVFWESPSSPITRKQAIKRISREGQKKRTFIYDLIIVGSIDQHVLNGIKDGYDLHDKLVEGKSRRSNFLLF